MDRGTAPARAQVECPFEYPPFETLFERALRDVVDHRLEGRERKAAARAISFLLREQLVSEGVATRVLSALHKSLDVSGVVRTLLIGLRDAVGDHERMTEWATKVAGRAHAQGHIESFVSALRVLVGLRDFDGALPTSWQLSLVRASEGPALRRRLVCLSADYSRRFGSEFQWVKTVRARYICGTSPDDPSADATAGGEAEYQGAPSFRRSG